MSIKLAFLFSLVAVHLLSQKQSSSSSALLNQHRFFVKVMDIIAPILSIVSLFCTCNGNNTCYLSDLQENKDALDTAMKELKATRADVKRRVDVAENNPNEPMERTHEVDIWLQRVETIDGEVVKVIQKADQEIKGRCIGSYCPKNCWSVHKIGKLVIRKLGIVNDLRSKGNFGDVAYKLPPPLVQKEPVDLTVGMESMFDKVLKSLAEDEVRIMGLYGQGGVGKTTLLKQINNEFLKGTTTTTHGFDAVIFVVVSKALNINAIQMEIGKRLGLSSPDRTSIFNALTMKNFVLLLDDIWEGVDLESIGVPHPENNKSKVVFTTRSENVCGVMDADRKFRVECLPWIEAWTLFQKKVGNAILNSHPRIRRLAKIVAKECGGLPLALITIGRAMSTKKTVQEWKHAITTLQQSASKFPGMGDKVLPLLKLSYDDLQNETIKSCFCYCALFPEDDSVYIPKVIDYWIGEGLILLNEFDHLEQARNHGYDIIGILKDACLLESGKYEETQVKMHDTIRDLALWITCECGSKTDKNCTITENNLSDLTSERLWYNAERIYLRCIYYSEGIEVPLPLLKSPNLLTLICEMIPYRMFVPQNFFEFMPLLRVLDLTHCVMRTFPISITELLELRYLSLSHTNIEVLPEELGKLVKLKYLDLSRMGMLKKIPPGVIGSLLELQVLNLYETTDWDLEEVYKLKHLNELGVTINTQQKLTKLLSSNNQNLQMCTRHLALSMTLGVDSMRILEKVLELLSNLETLLIKYFPMNIEWENNLKAQQHLHSFQNLSEISIMYCNALKDLTWVVYVGNLKTLEVSNCEQIEEIIGVVDDDFLGIGGDHEISKMPNIVNVFKRLKILRMMELPKLKSICRNALVFPCLESMHVFKCPQLKKLPFDSGSNVNNTLREILGGPKWWSELQWENDHHNVKSKFLPYIQSVHFYE